MGRWRVWPCVVSLALLAGCGDAESEAGDVAALGYMAPEAHVVAAVPTDFEGEQLRRLDRLVRPVLGGSLRDMLAGDPFEELEPLLGGPLVIGAWGDLDEPDVVVAIETTDGERAQEMLDELRDEGLIAAVDGDVLLFGVDAPRPTLLHEAIERRRDGQGMDADALPGEDDALLRVTGDPRPLVRDALPGAEEVPWVAALRSYDLTLRLEEDAVVADAGVRTDPAGLSEADLPLATGEESPPVGRLDGVLAAANRNQSRTTVFLTRLARAALADSRFVAAVEELEADLGISFEEEVLAQFDGPSASITKPNTAFGAVSDVADPERMRELLPKLVPRMPEILTALNRGLGSRGLQLLLLFAPDAPLTPGVLGALRHGMDIRARGGAQDEQLYEIDPGDGMEQVVFGMIGDRFVVASDMELAHTVAEMPLSEVDGARGAGVARTDFDTWSTNLLQTEIGVPTELFGELVAELEASLESLELRLRLDVPGGL
jgi:hypothetical protein